MRNRSSLAPVGRAKRGAARASGGHGGIVIVGRIIGWALVAAALAALGADIVASVAARSLEVTPLGLHWFEFHRASLGLAQAAVQRYLLPELWDPVIQTVLLWPTWAVFGAPGAALAYLCRRRRRRGSGLL